MSARVLYLSDELAASIRLSAARAYPSEACGLIEGAEVEDGWCATTVHEAANVADDPKTRFLIDPQTQFRLLRGLRGGDTRIIGCYHSHPNGVAEPSATDCASAGESDFLWLVAAGSPETGFTLRGYLFSEKGDFVPIALKAGT